MSCCGGGAGGNGAFPRRREGGCNCSRGQRHEVESGGCSEQGTTASCQSRGQQETTLRGPSGGCGRPGCPRSVVYPPPELPKDEWEYTNYNRNNHGWLATSVENSYPGYEADYVGEQDEYQSDNYEEFEGAENIQEACGYHNELEESGYQQSCERFGGGCDNYGENQQSYLDYYYEEEPVDQQMGSLPACTRCSESKSTSDSETDGSRDKRRVHF